VDRTLIEKKLESLRRCLVRIREKCPPTAEQLSRDPDAQDIVALNLTRAVQLSVDIGAHVIAATDAFAPETMGQTFDSLADQGLIGLELATRMKKSVGFRNIAVHNYEAIDWAIVHAIVTRHLGDFDNFAGAVSRILDKAAGIE
jgi:uncharacterized protein YutE (UPF0331/DUF86 family)